MVKRSSAKTLPALSACLLSIILSSACSFIKTPLQSSGSGFVREEFLEYRSIAILPFEGDEDGEVSDAFSISFHKKFPDMEIIERRDLKGIFRRQDLQLGQLNEEVKKRISRELDAQAFIIGNVYYPSITRWLLQIKIIDAETGEILGRSLAEVDFMGDLGFKEGCELAVQNLQPR
jgi:hypothetical protein